MTKKFFQCLSLLMIFALSIFGTAAAKSKAEITSVKAYDLNDETLRIEILFDGNLKTQDVSTKTFGNILTVSMQNTTPGRVSQIAGTKIENAESIQRITVKEMTLNNTLTRIAFESPIGSDDYTVSVQPANRSAKESARITDRTA